MKKNNIDIAIKLMCELKAKKEFSGNVACPVCNNIIDWIKSEYNNHVHLKCRTKDCIQIME